MIQSLRQLSILNKLFNIHGNEWYRVVFALAIRFFYRTSFVVGWTILLALFVSSYGIFALPYLFVLNAFFSIAGSLFYSLIFERYSKVSIMLSTILASGLFLFIASQLAENHKIAFFAFFIIAISIFLNQLRIILIAYVEELFTPLASERTFPIIEVSETLGGIVAGLLVTFLSDYFALYNFIYLVISILFLMIPFILFFHEEEEKVEILHPLKEDKPVEGIFSQLKEAFDSRSHSSFIIGLIAIVLFQWVIFNLLEFQYTKVVYQNVSHVIFEAGSGFEHAFVHDLGMLFILFSVSALVIEVFVGSRLITGLGVVGAMLLHPLITLLSLVGLTFRFDFLTAVLAKNNFTITSVIYTNTYHISYYAVKEKVREHVREFLEGIIRPLGAILGMGLIILFEKLFVGQQLIFVLNITMIFCALILFYVTYRQQLKYSNVATEELLNSKEKHVKFNAIDLLAQRGHDVAFSTFRKLLFDPNELTSVKIKILGVFAELKNPDTVFDIIKCLGSPKPEIYEAAIDTLMSFKFLHNYSKDYLFAKYQLITALKKLYSEEKNKEVLAKIIYLMSLLSNVATIEFLLRIVNSDDSPNKADALYALGKCDDREIAALLEKYLSSANPLYQINAAMALFNFKKRRADALYLINSFLYSDTDEKVMYGLLAVGELGLKSKKSVCLKYLRSDNVDLRMYSALALAKMGFYHSVSHILDLLFSGDETLVKKLKRLVKNVDVRVYKNIARIVKQVVAKKVEDYKSSNDTDSLKGFSADSLLGLKKLYTLVDEYEEIDDINLMLKNNL